MKYILSSLILLFLVSCENQHSPEGIWSFNLNLQQNKIPFYMQFKNDKVILKNNTELIELSYSVQDKKILIPILNYDAALELNLLADTLRGYWVKYNRDPEYKVSVFGMKTTLKQFPDSKESFFKESKKMKIAFADKSLGILTYQQGNTYASIVTETGDYRYLTPKRDKDLLALYGFDGVFAFYLKGEYTKDRYTGTLFAGTNYQQKFIAIDDPNFSLRDATQITTHQGNLPHLKLPNIKGEMTPLLTKDKPTIIQIFGSWCPNCIDETKFFVNWRKNHSDVNVDFKIVTFERSPNKEHALKLLRKTQKIYQIDYPILIGGFTKEDKLSKVFPSIKEFISFPTTIYVKKDGTTLKIHAGFNGPATGEYYEKFKVEFEKLVQEMTK